MKRTREHIPALKEAVNIPLRLLRARERFTRKMYIVFDHATNERIRYCKEHGINYFTDYIGRPSEDKECDTLSDNAIHYKVENIRLKMLISTLHHMVYKATNGEIFGHHYDGTVKSIIGNRSIASLVI